MATTFNDLADEVQINLSGYTFTQDKVTHLLADVASTASTISAVFDMVSSYSVASHDRNTGIRHEGWGSLSY